MRTCLHVTRGGIMTSPRIYSPLFLIILIAASSTHAATVQEQVQAVIETWASATADQHAIDEASATLERLLQPGSDLQTAQAALLAALRDKWNEEDLEIRDRISTRLGRFISSEAHGVAQAIRTVLDQL